MSRVAQNVATCRCSTRGWSSATITTTERLQRSCRHARAI